jgi:uncharacterized protein (DUF433 family)
VTVFIGMHGGYDGRDLGVEDPLAVAAFGRYIVADPDICHGQLTFRGTRVRVADVLEQVANGMAWETITEEWRGDVPREAIAEAVRLASEFLLAHQDEAAAKLAG